MNKRGQELSLNTLIVIILLVIALVVIAVFFLGGTSSLSRSIRSIFYGTTAGTDLNLALQTCEQRCEAAKNLPATPVELRKNSAYCKVFFDIDRNNDGKIDETASGGLKEKGLSCLTDLGLSCAPITCA